MFSFIKALLGADITALMPRIQSGEILLVDLRNSDELASTGKAKAALNIPLERLPSAADTTADTHHVAFKPDQPIALYCASGARSGYGKRILEQMGYEEVHNLGGLRRWIKAGGAISR